MSTKCCQLYLIWIRTHYLNSRQMITWLVHCSMNSARMLQCNFVGNVLSSHELTRASVVYDSHFPHQYLTDKRQTLAFYRERYVNVSRILYWIGNVIVSWFHFIFTRMHHFCCERIGLEAKFE